MLVDRRLERIKAGFRVVVADFLRDPKLMDATLQRNSDNQNSNRIRPSMDMLVPPCNGHLLKFL